MTQSFRDPITPAYRSGVKQLLGNLPDLLIHKNN